MWVISLSSRGSQAPNHHGNTLVKAKSDTKQNVQILGYLVWYAIHVDPTTTLKLSQTYNQRCISILDSLPWKPLLLHSSSLKTLCSEAQVQVNAAICHWWPLSAVGDWSLHIFQWVVRKRFSKCSLLYHHFTNNYSGSTWDRVSRTPFHRYLQLLVQEVLFSVSPHCGTPAFVPVWMALALRIRIPRMLPLTLVAGLHRVVNHLNC